jgi:hypothetical protein
LILFSLNFNTLFFGDAPVFSGGLPAISFYLTSSKTDGATIIDPFSS